MSVEEAQSIEENIKAVFNEIDQTYNNWNPHSEISRLNQLKAHFKVPLSSAMQDFLSRTGILVKLTNGLFDPTIQPLHALWKRKLQRGEIPSRDEIELLLPAIGWDKIHFEEQTFFKEHDLVSMDFGGIAKGHCIDLIAERLLAAGYRNFYVEWGGEIRASGKHPENRAWRVFISRLGDPNRENGIGEIELIDTALATSGDYLQNWSVKIDGKRVSFSHIIDPRTSHPLPITRSSIASASILAPSCEMADAIATAVMLQNDVEDGKAWFIQLQEQLPLFDCWLHSRKDDMVQMR